MTSKSDSVVEEVIAGQSASQGAPDISTVATGMQDLAKCAVIAQNANTATKQLLQNATSEQIEDRDNTGVIGASVKTALPDEMSTQSFLGPWTRSTCRCRPRRVARAAAAAERAAAAAEPLAAAANDSLLAPTAAERPAIAEPLTGGERQPRARVHGQRQRERMDRRSQAKVASKIAEIAGSSDVVITNVTAADDGGVFVTVTIAVPASDADEVMKSLTDRLGSAEKAKAELGIEVESTELPRLSDEETGITSQEKKQMALLALLVLLCPLLCCVYICVQYDGKVGKYLSWRFSHTNPFILVGYMPKERRDALWQEIQDRKGHRSEPERMDSMSKSSSRI